MYPGVKKVKALPGFKLQLTFENNEEKIFDVNPFLDKGVFKELKDARTFNTVHISFDTVEWANGADLCPELLYTESTTVGNNCL